MIFAVLKPTLDPSKRMLFGFIPCTDFRQAGFILLEETRSMEENATYFIVSWDEIDDFTYLGVTLKEGARISTLKRM